MWEKCGVLKRAISLVVIDEKLFDDEENYHEQIFMRRLNGKVFTKLQEINIIDLTKIEYADTPKKQSWGQLFKVRTREELEMLINESEEMSVAAKKLIEISEDERNQMIAMSFEHAMERQRLVENGAKRRIKEAEQIEERAEKMTENATKLAMDAKQKMETAEKQIAEADLEIKSIRKQQDAEKLKSARNFLEMGMTPEQVAKGLKLDLSVVLEVI